MSECGLPDPIPLEFGIPVNLYTLFMQVNSLSGLISLEPGNLTSLNSMDLLVFTFN
jgi:hypothetical protein